MTPEQAKQLQHVYDLFKGGAAEVVRLSAQGAWGYPNAQNYVMRADAAGNPVTVSPLQEIADAKTLLLASAGREAAMLQALQVIGAGGGIDDGALERIRAAAEAGVEAALAKVSATVNVELTAKES